MAIPLAHAQRPQAFDEVLGQDHLVGPSGLITEMIEKKCLVSLLLWGPPGCGKTTIASLYAQAFESDFIQFSATTNKMSELKKILEDKKRSPLFRSRLIVFVDEIHRFNRAQQDTFLPMVEKGEIILIGATTENPSFALNSALLSRLKTFQLNPLDPQALQTILNRFLENEKIEIAEKAAQSLVETAGGDGRYLYSLLEMVRLKKSDKPIQLEDLETILKYRSYYYENEEDQHFNLISALHKAVRGSDVQASLYWLLRMLIGGEDPIYICRRMIRMASEDIGLADPNALRQTLDALEAFKVLGSPEGELAIANCITYLALAPKSNAGYIAYNKAMDGAKKTAQHPPPKHICNAPTKWMKDQGYGKGYQYDHDHPFAVSGQNFMPEGLNLEDFYVPNERGYERELLKRLLFFKKVSDQKF